MGSPVAPRPDDLPEGFTLDPDLPEGFMLDEPGAVAPPGGDAGSRFAQALPGAVGRNLVGTITGLPGAVAGAAKLVGRAATAGANPISLGAEFGPDVVEAARNLRDTASTPEGAAELTGAGLVSAIPFGNIAAGIVRKLGANPASRAHNIIRALRASERQIPAIERAAPEIDLPVVASHRKLAAELAGRRESTGAAVRTAEAALPPTPVSTSAIIGRMDPPAGQWVARGDTMEFIPDDPTVASAFNASTDRLVAAGPLTAQDALRIKRSEQAIAARGKAYERSLPGEDAAVQAGVARAKAAAIRAELEALPGPEAAALTAANRAHHVAALAETPAARELIRIKKQPFMQRGTEILLGRAGAGGRTTMGAVTGLAGGQILDSTLFHTASAATKQRVMQAINSGMPQQAIDILMRTALTDNQLRQQAREAIAQGEGVTAP